MVYCFYDDVELRLTLAVHNVKHVLIRHRLNKDEHATLVTIIPVLEFHRQFSFNYFVAEPKLSKQQFKGNSGWLTTPMKRAKIAVIYSAAVSIVDIMNDGLNIIG